MRSFLVFDNFDSKFLSPPMERSELEEIMKLVDLSVVVSACPRVCLFVCLCSRIGGDMHSNKRLLVYTRFSFSSLGQKLNKANGHTNQETKTRQRFVHRSHGKEETVHTNILFASSQEMEIGGSLINYLINN